MYKLKREKGRDRYKEREKIGWREKEILLKLKNYKYMKISMIAVQYLSENYYVVYCDV